MISLVFGFVLHTDEDQGIAVDLDSLAGADLGIALVDRDSEATTPAVVVDHASDAVSVVELRAECCCPCVLVLGAAHTAADDGNHLAVAVTAAVPA